MSSNQIDTLIEYRVFNKKLFSRRKSALIKEYELALFAFSSGLTFRP